MTEDYNFQYYTDINLKLRDLEEKNRILKDRLLLIGENLVEVKENFTQDVLILKKDFEEIKSTLNRLKNFVETASSEFSKFARKEDLEILSKQAKMFQPLDFLRKSDLEKLKKN
ncbi:MAG: hypothetical protein AABW51_01120 [Nanoarchaeota archaeon]